MSHTLKRKAITSKIEGIDGLDCQINQTSPGDLHLYLYLPLYLKPQGQAFLLLWKSEGGQMMQLLVAFMCTAEPLCLPAGCWGPLRSHHPFQGFTWGMRGARCPLGLATKRKKKLYLNLEIYRNAEQPCCSASCKPALLGALPFVGLKEWGTCCQVGHQCYKQMEGPYPTSNLDLVTGRQLE